jgi:hypothetical protein
MGVDASLHWPVELSDAEVGAVDVPCATLPTATHDPEGGHERPDTAVNFGGGVALLQVDPPFELAMNTGAAAPVSVAPAPTHAVADWQETSKIDAEPAGSVADWKVDPPFVVSTASPGALRLNSPAPLGPTATQVVALAQLMERSWPMPPSTGAMVHVFPPLVLTRTLEPTAMHVVAVGQATAATAATLVGMAAWVQVLPPSSDVNTMA